MDLDASPDAIDALDQAPAGGDTEADIARDLEEAIGGGDSEVLEASDDPADDIRKAVEEQGNALAEGEARARAAADWNTEFDALYNQALGVHGLSAEQAAAQGHSREEIVRRAFAADRVLREDPATGLASLAASYAGGLAAEQRAAIAVHTLRALGFPDGFDGLAAAHRAELQAYREQTAARQAAYDAAIPVVVQRIEAFAKSPGHPHFAQLRSTMAQIVQAGLANDLEGAYRLAAQHAGLPAPGVEADQARRDAVARAKAASTPRTASRPVPDIEDEFAPPGETIEQTLRNELARHTERRGRI